ncbi:hypothetical protein P4B35_13245 [Pontiellaceae bacterium B12227]|nr:hypothetical protein [Pontiellaceae bacterium B12227]
MRTIINVDVSKMTAEKAHAILVGVKKKKIANGTDLAVATRGAEGIYGTMFAIVMLMLVLSLQPFIREYPAVLSGIVILGSAFIIPLSISYRKVATVREFMILKRVFHLDEIEK